MTSPIVCYCKNVTEDEIIHHVAVKKCCSTMEDIQRHTGVNTGTDCTIKNPSGL
jgi:bacterioferritin-associated ferredoxin